MADKYIGRYFYRWRPYLEEMGICHPGRYIRILKGKILDWFKKEFLVV
jgi:hypothetical protein